MTNLAESFTSCAPSKSVGLIVSPALGGGRDGRRTDSQGNMGLVPRSPQPTVPASRQGRLALRLPAHARWGQWGWGDRRDEMLGVRFVSWGPICPGGVAGLGFGGPGLCPLCLLRRHLPRFPGERSVALCLPRRHLPVAVTAKGTWDWYRNHPDWRFQSAVGARFALRPPAHARVGERKPGLLWSWPVWGSPPHRRRDNHTPMGSGRECRFFSRRLPQEHFYQSTVEVRVGSPTR